MNDPAGAASGDADGGAQPATAGDELERLRRLLLAAERNRLGALEHRLADPEWLSPVLEEALSVSIKRNRRHLAEAIAPAMGPAIRRAIAEALRTVVDSFNQVLQHSLSPRSLRWRAEAWRTGRPFAEVVLSHSLVFRVEQVFLVHRKTGLLLQHVAESPAAAQDADLVSGMLTAIQDFVRDSFSVESEQAVDTMRVGDLGVWVEQGEEAYIAALIRGTPPVALRGELRETLEAIHLECSDAFESFSGDAAPFDHVRHHLEGCLQLQVAARRGRRSWLAPAIAAGLVVAALVAWLALSLVAARRWNTYLARLDQEAGIVVTREDGGIRRSSIAGLADPDAADPDALLAACGLDRARVTREWEPYISLEPAVVLRRARRVLQPPAPVTLLLANGTLSAAGSAPHRWVVAATARAMTIPGVLRFDTGELVDEGMVAIAPTRARLEATTLLFDVGAVEPRPAERERFERVAADLKELASVAAGAGLDLGVQVVGHTDGTGSEGTNVRLSRARAEWVASALEAGGANDLTVAVLGVGASRPLRSEETEADRAQNRSVTFRVVTSPRLPPPPE